MQDFYSNHGNKPSHSIKAVCVMTILKWSRHKLLEEQPSPIQGCCFEGEPSDNAKTLDVRAENVLEAKFLGYRMTKSPIFNRLSRS